MRGVGMVAGAESSASRARVGRGVDTRGKEEMGRMGGGSGGKRCGLAWEGMFYSRRESSHAGHGQLVLEW